ncbi:MAG: 30S ribosomal protein S20 [Finegoldia sp.]|nr:30S ribosomal protein S20 [Finegoldia sp.]
MANIKSAIKRIDVTNKQTQRNKAKKSEVKTYIKKFEQAVEANNKEEAAKYLKVATKKLDKLASKNTISKNSASRKISKLNKAFNKIA